MCQAIARGAPVKSGSRGGSTLFTIFMFPREMARQDYYTPVMSNRYSNLRAPLRAARFRAKKRDVFLCSFYASACMRVSGASRVCVVAQRKR